MYKKQSQAGATLIEILIALLILSLGLLGMAGLQARALKGNHSAAQRSQAVIMSYYILEAMRVDASKAKALDYNTGNVDAYGVIDAVCNPAVFTDNNLPDNNMKAWLTHLKSTIGTASDSTTCGGVFCDSDGNCTVQVFWDDSIAGGLGAQKIESTTRL